MTRIRLGFGAGLCVLLLGVTVSLAPSPPCWAADPLTATFEASATGNLLAADQVPGVGVQDCLLALEFLPDGGAGEALASLCKHLGKASTYTVQTTEGHPFVVEQAAVAQVAPPSDRWKVRLYGMGPTKATGSVYVTVPEGWQFRVEDGDPTGTGTQLKLNYYYGKDWTLPTFRPKVLPAWGSGGFSVSATGEGVVGRGRSYLSTLTLHAQFPIGIPDDVEDTPGADTAASRENPGRLSLAWNRIGYAHGGKQAAGATLRLSGPLDDLQGFEGVLYYEPVMGWFPKMRGCYGAELEAGFRSGDAEWESLTTLAPDRGNFFARLGVVAEYAPELWGINRDLSNKASLRLFLRGRGWADMYEDPGGATAVRFRQFLDAELFANFGDQSQWRWFVRWQNGYLPPDLTTLTNQAWFGVGVAF